MIFFWGTGSGFFGGLFKGILASTLAVIFGLIFIVGFAGWFLLAVFGDPSTYAHIGNFIGWFWTGKPNGVLFALIIGLLYVKYLIWARKKAILRKKRKSVYAQMAGRK